MAIMQLFKYSTQWYFI